MTRESYYKKRLKLSAKVNLSLTEALKEALYTVAARRNLSFSDVVRQSMLAGMDSTFPEFFDIYNEILEEGDD